VAEAFEKWVVQSHSVPMAHRLDIEGLDEIETSKALRGVGNKEGYPPSQPTRGSGGAS